MLTFFYSIFLPLIIGSLVETFVLRGAAKALRFNAITWSHCFVFAFFSVSVAVLFRNFNFQPLANLGFTGLATLSLLLHAFLGAVIFRGVPLAPPIPKASLNTPTKKRRNLPKTHQNAPAQPLGAARGALVASLGFVGVALFFYAVGQSLARISTAPL